MDTTPQNLILHSKPDTTQTAWTTENATATVDTNETSDPFGGNNATKVEDAAGVALHRSYQSISFNSSPFSFVVWAKNGVANPRRYLRLYISRSDGGVSVDRSCGFDLQTGVTFANATTDDANLGSILEEPAGTGWYRCTLKVPTCTVTFGQILMSDGTSSLSYNGNGSRLYLFGVRLARCLGPYPYYPTTTAALNTSGVRRPLRIFP